MIIKTDAIICSTHSVSTPHLSWKHPQHESSRGIGFSSPADILTAGMHAFAHRYTARYTATLPCSGSGCRVAVQPVRSALMPSSLGSFPHFFRPCPALPSSSGFGTQPSSRSSHTILPFSLGFQRGKGDVLLTFANFELQPCSLFLCTWPTILSSRSRKLF